MVSNAEQVSHIATMTWVEFERNCQKIPIIVIPSGAIEVYGPHLPLGSDSIVADAISTLVANELGALRTPLIPVGYSADLMEFPGTLSVNPEAFKGYLEGICRSLIKWRLHKFLFINTHLGNVALIDQVVDELSQEHDLLCMQIDWWRFAARLGSDLFESEWAAGHAGELGTSVLQYLAEETVNHQARQDFIPPNDPWPSGITRYISYRQITPSGVLGVSTAGNREKGKVIVQRCVDAIVKEAKAFFD